MNGGGYAPRAREGGARPRRLSGPGTWPLNFAVSRGSICHRRCKCPVDFCAGCHRSRWLLGDLGCFERQTPSVDTRRCVPNPQHPRAQLPVGFSVACTFCAGIFLAARINCLASFASNTHYRDFGRCAAGAQWCLSTVAFRTRCFERRSGVRSCSRTMFHGCSPTSCSIRYRPPSIRRVFPWSCRSVRGFGRIGGPVPVCPARGLTTRSSGGLRDANPKPECQRANPVGVRPLKFPFRQ